MPGRLGGIAGRVHMPEAEEGNGQRCGLKIAEGFLRIWECSQACWFPSLTFASCRAPLRRLSGKRPDYPSATRSTSAASTSETGVIVLRLGLLREMPFMTIPRAK